jgi:hypothetical protein
MIFDPRKRRRGGKTNLDSIAMACCSQFLIGQGVRPLIYSWLGKNKWPSLWPDLTCFHCNVFTFLKIYIYNLKKKLFFYKRNIQIKS